MPVSLCTLLAIKYLQHKSFCVCMTVHACMHDSEVKVCDIDAVRGHKVI